MWHSITHPTGRIHHFPSSLVLILLLLATSLLGALGSAGPTPVDAQAAGQPQVDVVFAMDTSGSMDDESQALCEQITQLIRELQERGIVVQYRILNITPQVDFASGLSCATDSVQMSISSATVMINEDWGPAVRDLAIGYPWQPQHVRLVIPISDEGPYLGEPCEDPGPDRTAIQQAILAAQSNKVRVAPILGSGHESEVCNADLADALARSTGGRVFLSTTPASDLARGIEEIIGDVANDQDGDGLPDDKDPAPQDPCEPNPQAVCLPQQACGISNTPHWDDDQDGRTDEELPNRQDDDGDGLIDEDVGGPNCPFPPQDCGVNSHRSFDDDGDGRIDEELDNERDDDGDGYVDEDVMCACPPPQILATATKGVDDDHDFSIDEELANGIDDDGDGCVDEDVGDGASSAQTTTPMLPLVTGRITYDDENPLVGAVVGILAGTDDLTRNGPALISALTDADGRYQIRVPWNPTVDTGNSYRVRISLIHYDNIDLPSSQANPIFAVAHSPDPTRTQPVFLVLTPFTLSSAQDRIDQSAHFKTLKSLPLGSYVNLSLDQWETLPDLAGIYVRIYQAYRYARDAGNGLGLPPFNQTLLIRAFVEDNDLRSADFTHTATGAQIRIRPAESRWNYSAAPKNIEWHEFGHYVMYLSYSGIPSRPRGRSWDDPAYDAHAGYANPDTTASFVEGWATFYAAAIALWRGEKNASSYPPTLTWPVLPGLVRHIDFLVKPDLEPNHKLWEGQPTWAKDANFTNREEFAVAGILWDLLDPGTEVKAVDLIGRKSYDSVQIPARDLWEAITSYRRADGVRGVSTVRDLYLAVRNNRDLLAKANASAAEIEQIFYEHGAYMDPGSYRDALLPDLFGFSGGRYPHKNYPQRPDVPGLPGAAVKISTHGLFGTQIRGITLTVSTRYPEPFQVYDTETQVYMTEAEDIFYYEPPPESYATSTSIIGVTADGSTSLPWVIDNQAFWRTWTRRLEQAGSVAPEYVLEHSFVFPPARSTSGTAAGAGIALLILTATAASLGTAALAARRHNPPAKLWVRQAGGGWAVPMKKSRFTIGRSGNNQLVLKGDLVSRQHAVIRRAGADYTIEDLASTTGTFVNHQRITRAVLHDGDEIGIGETLMVFRSSTSGAMRDA